MDGHSSRIVIGASAAALALFLAACGGESDDATAAATTVPATTATTATTPATGTPSGLKTIDPAAVQDLVDATMKDLGVPGAVVLLRTPQGEVAATYGTTELGTDDRPDAETHFRIASITKTMTSAVILQLDQEGTLRLDDPVSKYVPDVPHGDEITLAQLLEMRSGLYSFTDAPEMSTAMDDDPTRVWTPQELLAIAFAQPMMFAPGAEYYYSNTNYVLLGLIIEQLDGRPLAASFEDRLFGPLGMKDTIMPAPDSHTIPAPFSHGYLYGSASHVMLGTPPYTPEEAAAAEAGTLQPNDFTDINHSFSFAAGAVTSTAADLATWFEALGSGKVLDAEHQRLWQDSAKIIDPKNSYNWYGYGIDQLRWGSNTIDLHGGQTPGFNSEAAYDPDNDMTVVIWTNLTMALDNQFTAVVMMLKLIDLIYEQSPVPPTTTTTVP
jgi:D-alanyl-D-alanine carboxypeptidase